MMLLRRAACGMAALLLAGAVSGVAGETTSIDFDWRFFQGDPAGAEAPGFDDSGWRQLDVPHDWSIEGDYDPFNPTGGQGGYLPAGIGWYRRVIDVPASWSGKRVAVRFDAIFSNSSVWCNGRNVGGRAFGYLSFECDLTPCLHSGRNVLAVRVDNSLTPANRWYTGAGIYGHARLEVADRIHVPTGGVFVRTPEVAAAEATVQVSTEIRNDTSAATATRVHTAVVAPGGAMVAEAEGSLLVASNGVASIDQPLQVKAPKLWSPETPELYTLVTRVLADGAVRDERRTPFGIRSIRWDKDRGFLLNGEVVKLRGVGLHHDGGPVGAAIPDALNTRRLRQMKEMGANAVRTAHNPRTPFFYDECDRLGLMVMDEVFDGWRKKAEHDYGAHNFTNCWRQDVTDWVRRDRNHPSIIIYSIGNETGKEDIHGITTLVHSLDSTRPTTGGRMTDGVDVVGLNGEAASTTGMEKIRRQHRGQPLMLTEEPHTYQTRGFYRVLSWSRQPEDEPDDCPPYGTQEVFTTGGDRRYNSSYDNAVGGRTARGTWRRTAATPWIAGEFRWTGFDYHGEAGYTTGGFPARSFNQGVMDLAGLPKDLYYFYQSVWTQRPMVHLLPHWTHPGLEGKSIPVVAYSNCEEIELFLNGRSLGRKTRREWLDFVWSVPYAPGELRAIGYRSGHVAAEFTARTAGTPARLRLDADNSALAADRVDMSLVTFAVTDAAGVVVPAANDRVDFAIRGPVKLLGFENGDPLDVTAHRVSWRKVFAGLGRGFFQSTSADGPIEVTAAAILGEREFETNATVSFDVQRVSLRGPLTPAVFEIHYTTDGSEPTAQSPTFASPLRFSTNATVRALVCRDGQALLNLSAELRREPKQPWTDPRFRGGGVKVGALSGPFAKALVGRWRYAEGTIELRADGVMLRHDAGSLYREVGWWRYDLPEAAAGGVGAGELLWKDGRAGQMKLVSRNTDAFEFREGKGAAVVYKRTQANSP